jgi:hypothetical protein
MIQVPGIFRPNYREAPWDVLGVRLSRFSIIGTKSAQGLGPSLLSLRKFPIFNI